MSKVDKDARMITVLEYRRTNTVLFIKFITTSLQQLQPTTCSDVLGMFVKTKMPLEVVCTDTKMFTDRTSEGQFADPERIEVYIVQQINIERCQIVCIHVARFVKVSKAKLFLSWQIIPVWTGLCQRDIWIERCKAKSGNDHDQHTCADGAG